MTSVHPRHFWQARFYDFNVWTEKKRIEKLRYIHRNPVTRGLVDSPEKWKWSSFRSYMCGETGPVKINDSSSAVIGAYPVVGPGGVLYVAWAAYNSKQVFIDKSNDCGTTAITTNLA